MKKYRLAALIGAAALFLSALSGCGQPASGLPPERTARVLACVSCDEALRILREADVDRTALARLTERIAFHLAARAGESLEVGAILFSKVWGELSRTGNAAQLLQQIVKGGT